MSISSKLEQWCNSPEGKKRMDAVVNAARKQTNSKFNPKKRAMQAAQSFIQTLQNTARSYNLPNSVMKHIDNMSASSSWNDDGWFVVSLCFGGDLHRDSLENDLGYEGIDNIVALFNNGYSEINYVYGWWNGHSPSGSATSRSSSVDGFAWVRSKNKRESLRFIQQAINDFNKNYGNKFGAIALVGNDIYEQ